MKIGPVDGSMEECRDFFENNGLKLEDYLEKPTAQLKTCYIAIPSVVIACALLAVILLGSSTSQSGLNILYMIAFGGGTWLTVSIQLRFQNGIATFIVAMGVISMLLVAAGVLSLKEAGDFVKDVARGE